MKPFAGKRFVVTGSTGRLGVDLCHRIEELGGESIPLVFAGYPAEPKRVKWIAKSRPILVENAKTLENIKADCVIHLHWHVDRTKSFAEQLEYEIHKNVSSLRFFWDWVKSTKLEKLINISTIKVLARPLSPYGNAKIASENFLDSYLSGTEVLHLRIPSVCSAGEHPSQLMTQLFNSAFNDKKITLNANHETFLLYIDEIVDRMIAGLKIKSQKNGYNLVPKGYSNLEIAKTFEKVSGRKLNAEINTESVFERVHFESDIQKFDSDWTRRLDLEQMCEKIITGYSKI